MADTSVRAAMMLASHDMVQLRLMGTLLTVLVHRKILTGSEASALVDDALRFLPEDDVEMRQAYSELRDQLRE